jgi:hypothetical protein
VIAAYCLAAFSLIGRSKSLGCAVPVNLMAGKIKPKPYKIIVDSDE